MRSTVSANRREPADGLCHLFADCVEDVIMPGIRFPAFDRRELAAIFVGGALGTVLRAAVADEFPRAVHSWPWPTFGVNIAAALLLGYVVTRLQERLPISSYRRPLWGTGLCGGLSTFSTMQVELLRMLDAHAYALAAAYTGASLVGGYLAVHIATSVARRTPVGWR